MKRFDPVAGYDRYKKRVEKDLNLSQIAENGTIDSILKATSEVNAEIIRYLEYLYLETKFKNSRNLSSITHMTDLIGYKRQLPKSAIGYIIVSHTDQDGKNRLQNFGTSFFDLDAPSDYDELVKKTNATNSEKAALVPWTANEFYSIPEGTIFTTANGTKFIATETVESRSLKEPFSVIKKDAAKYKDFIDAGGWNGIKYLKVPVIQGEETSIELGEAEGTRFESFTIDTLNVENASNIISCKYFTITVKPQVKEGYEKDNTYTETWERIPNIKLADEYDKVFETKILDDEGKLLIKFGDGITGKMLPEGALITVNFLTTKGALGNVDLKYQITGMALPEGFQMVDPRTNAVSSFLNCTNISPIMGGKDIESQTLIKENAPSSYLKSYTTGTKTAHLERIINESPVNLLHCKLFTSAVVDAESYGTTDDSSEYASCLDENYNVLQEITTDKKAMLISALRANGENIEDPESELLIPLRQVLDDYSSKSDSLEFIQPNKIEIRPNIIVTTSSSKLESDIRNELLPKIVSKYSIFYKDFGDKYFKSNLTDIAHSLDYAKSIECILEAKANVEMEPIIYSQNGQTNTNWLEHIGNTVNDMSKFDTNEEQVESLFGFKFSFDQIFAQNELGRGFKNYKYKAPYLIKADIIFNEDPTNSKTLILYDNRTDLLNEIDIDTAYKTPIEISKSYPLLEKTFYGESKIIYWPKNEDESFQNLQMRTAQYPLIDKITNDKYMTQVKSFLLSPFEVRPLYIDEAGNNKIFDVKDVPAQDQVSFNYDADVKTSTCYRKNWQYWNHCKIEFSENYNNPKAQDYASGMIIVPVKNILSAKEIASLKQMFAETKDFDEQTPDIKKMLKEKLTINVYAVPVQDTFECNNEYDIIYSDKNRIQIEKNFIIK
ncbi:MAG: hypothetical protein HUJ68_10875 [Clostridia bacterium]|nr:hypothetical protein [Clostridia bacterium]